MQKNTRDNLEKELGKSVISKENALNYKYIDDKKLIEDKKSKKKEIIFINCYNLLYDKFFNIVMVGDFMKRLTKRYIIDSLKGLNLSNPIRYERYYINDGLRIQKKNDKYEKEILDDMNNIVEKIDISKAEFLDLKKMAYSEIIRDSYILLDNKKISIKKYLGRYLGLYRVEIAFDSEKEKNEYVKEKWMGKEITNSPLAFDKYLSKLSNDEFREELKKYL